MHKILIIGSSSVGKTSWLNKIVHNKYDENYIATTQDNNYNITHKNISITCIDTVGTKTDEVLHKYDIDAIIIMCDFNGEDLENVKKWKLKLDNIKFKKY